MNIVGFIKEHEGSKNPNLGIPLNALLSGEKKSQEERSKIARYLDSGTVLMQMLHYVFDEKNNPIGPYGIYTDGSWIWPNYYSYYFKNHEAVIIPESFFNHMKNKNFIMATLSNDEINHALLFYLRIFPPLYPASLREKLEKEGLLNEENSLAKWWS